MPPNHYQVLGVAPTATQEQIRRAYRALAKQHHPDVNAYSDAAKWFSLIVAAYEVLSNPERRREHDRALAARAAPRERSTSDLRQGHYAWVSVAAPGSSGRPDISEVDDLYETFFRPRAAPGARDTQQPPNKPAKKPPSKRGRRS
jgi:curved DNA-binding protein CbpA